MNGARRSAIRRTYAQLANVSIGKMRQLLRGSTRSLIGVPTMPPLEPEALEQLLELQLKRQCDLTDEDHALLARAVAKIRELLERRPNGDVRRSAWRRRLMYLGHDPLEGAAGTEGLGAPILGVRSLTRGPTGTPIGS